MCRQYGDYGSIDRDREEVNPNSLDFVEFIHKERVTSDQAAVGASVVSKKTALNGEKKANVTNGNMVSK